MTHNIIKDFDLKASILIILCLGSGQLEAMLNCMDFTSFIFYSQKCAKKDVLLDLATTAFDLLPFCLPFSSLLELNVLQYYTYSELIYFFHTGERIMAPLCECFSAWGLPPSPHIINIQHLVVVESSRLAYTYLDVIIEV